MSKYEDEFDDEEIADGVMSCLATLIVFCFAVMAVTLADYYGWMELLP